MNQILKMKALGHSFSLSNSVIVSELTWPCIRNKQGMQLHECDWLACLTQSSKLSFFSSCHLFPISGHIASKITCQKKPLWIGKKMSWLLHISTAWTAKVGYEWKKICFHFFPFFFRNVLSLSKCGSFSNCAFIFKT